MKWSEVTFLYHDIGATVLFDTPHTPGVVEHFTGQIRCANRGDLPLLRNTKGIFNPPQYAAVILHPPTPT